MAGPQRGRRPRRSATLVGAGNQGSSVSNITQGLRSASLTQSQGSALVAQVQGASAPNVNDPPIPGTNLQTGAWLPLPPRGVIHGLAVHQSFQVQNHRIESSLFQVPSVDITALPLFSAQIPTDNGATADVVDWIKDLASFDDNQVAQEVNRLSNYFHEARERLDEAALITQAVLAQVLTHRPNLQDRIRRAIVANTSAFKAWRDCAISGHDNVTRKQFTVQQILAKYQTGPYGLSYRTLLTDPFSPASIARLGRNTLEAIQQVLSRLRETLGTDVPYRAFINHMDQAMVTRLLGRLRIGGRGAGSLAYHWTVQDTTTLRGVQTWSDLNSIGPISNEQLNDLNYYMGANSSHFRIHPSLLALIAEQGYTEWSSAGRPTDAYVDPAIPPPAQYTISGPPQTLGHPFSLALPTSSQVGPSPGAPIDRAQYATPEEYLNAHHNQQRAEDDAHARQTAQDRDAAREEAVRRSDRLAAQNPRKKGGLTDEEDFDPTDIDDDDDDNDDDLYKHGDDARNQGAIGAKSKSRRERGAQEQGDCLCNVDYVDNALKTKIVGGLQDGVSQVARMAIFNKCCRLISQYQVRNQRGGGVTPFCINHLNSICRLAGLAPAGLSQQEKVTRMKAVFSSLDVAKLKTGTGGDPKSWQWFERGSRPAHPSERLGPYKFVPTKDEKYWKMNKKQQKDLFYHLCNNLAATSHKPFSDGHKQLFNKMVRGWEDDGSVELPNLFTWFKTRLDNPIKLGTLTYTCIWDFLEVELACYSWHQRTEEHLGWMRTAFFSFTQMIIRQDPLYWAFYAATRNDRNHWLISYPYYMKFATNEDQTKFRHIDLNIKNLIEKKIGDGQVQGSVSLDTERADGCTELLMGMHKDGRLAQWWQSLVDANSNLGGEEGTKQKLTDGLVQAITPQMWTKEHAAKFGTNFKAQPITQFSARLSQPHLPHGATQMKSSKETKIRRTVFPWYQGIADDHHALEFPKGGTWESVSSVYSTLDPGSNNWLTPSGLANKYARAPYPFPATVPFYASNPISEALLGRRRWDMAYMSQLTYTMLVTNLRKPDQNKDNLIDLHTQYRREVAQLLPGLFQRFRSAELHIYQDNSFFKAIESGVGPSNTPIPAGWRTSHFKDIPGSSTTGNQDIQANLAQEHGWEQRASGAIAGYRPEMATRPPSSQVPGG